jgi:hypothetical protein
LSLEAAAAYFGPDNGVGRNSAAVLSFCPIERICLPLGESSNRASAQRGK